jgi:hypothetical protein
VPIFWESVWNGNDPGWLNAPPEETNTGAFDQQPAMWSSTAYDAYSTYVLTTLKAVQDFPGYGGSYIDTLTGGSRVTLGNVNSYSGTITVNPASGITSHPLTYNESMAPATIIEQDVPASRNSG